MCEKCVEACKEYFPDREDEWGDLLMSFTSFPLGTPESIREQLKHLAEVGPDQVIKEFDEKYETIMSKTNIREEREGLCY